MRRALVVGLFVVGGAAAIACGDSGGTPFIPPTGGSDVPGTDDDGATTPPTPIFGDDSGTPTPPEHDGAASIDCDADPNACLPPAVCGDKVGGLGENCDDGNTANGDGCSSTCQIEAPYWACTFGSLCVDVRDCNELIDAGLAGDGGEAGCITPPKTPLCGDGILDPGEACDDKNTGSNDGCSFDCKAVEANWVCPTPGVACTNTVVCGDGKITGNETCDDKNTKAGDGCSSTCQLEDGWVCLVPATACTAAKCGDGKLAGNEECDDGANVDDDGCSAACRLQSKTTTVDPTATDPGGTTTINYYCPTPGMPCQPTTCGDGTKQGTEQCDDNNVKPFDGCSPTCQIEPRCASGTCTAQCGDGSLFDFDADGDGKNDEECDDGNTRDGDGCSHDCKVESGYQCNVQASDFPPFLDLPVVFRDFKYWDSNDATSHPDFQRYGCNQVTEDLTLTNLSLPTAGLDWRVPVYRYDGTGNDPVTGTDPNGNCGAGGGGDTSKQLTSAADFTDWYADVQVGGQTRASRIDGHQLRLSRSGAAGNYSYAFDSAGDEPYKTRGGFFPIDGEGWGDQSNGHNFAFSTELRYWFTYDKTQSPSLDFSGDDDVWVFVNGQLALDLGGLHSKLTDSFTLDNAKANSLGLVDGHLYEVALFHAERHTSQSNFKLTLRGFVQRRSTCGPVCGNSIKTPEEQCDDGTGNTNSGAYGSCKLDCTLGPYCGDKQTHAPEEECDDGVNLTNWTPSDVTTACGPGCKKPAYCGDGTIQASFGEKCDDGKANNTGAYDHCNPDCSPGPRCGDGTPQTSDGEQCDNGFNLTPYVKHPGSTDCAPQCKTPRSCGDGVIEPGLEQCDKGAANTNDGSYNSCTTECVYGPRCGDGVTQGTAGEQCDDGNRVNGDGCSAACLSEGPITK